MSTTQERLFEIYSAYKTANDNRTRDLKAATSDAEVDAVLANIDKLHAAYLTSVNADLETSGPEVDAAYEASRAANRNVTAARVAAQDLASLIRVTAHAADTIGRLVQAARA